MPIEGWQLFTVYSSPDCTLCQAWNVWTTDVAVCLLMMFHSHGNMKWLLVVVRPHSHVQGSDTVVTWLDVEVIH